MSISVIDILWFLLAAARWTLLLSVIAFVGGGIGALLLLLLRYARPNIGVRFMNLYVEVLQGTPLLLQLFLVFFGLPLLGIDVSPILAAGVAQWERLLGITPAVIARDLHPEYGSARLARDWPGRIAVVQHHHAHVAACLAVPR